MIVQRVAETGIVYPESDGQPMADNTKQFRWITVIVGNLAALFREDANVFVAGNLLWYPVEGHPEICAAPDGFVAFGRPKGDRGSYRQWEEGGVAPQVVFEVLSPNNDVIEMIDKLSFYDDHGVEEYYVYDPDANRLVVYQRQGSVLRRARGEKVWTSPRLGIRFDLSEGEMKVYYPDGRLFQTYEEIVEQLEKLGRERDQATQERDRATQERDLATQERDRATQERNRATQERDQARQQIRDAEERAVRLAERLRQAGLDPNA